MEHAPLTVRPGEQAAFEAASGRARPLIAAVPAFRGLSLSRCYDPFPVVELDATVLTAGPVSEEHA